MLDISHSLSSYSAKKGVGFKNLGMLQTDVNNNSIPSRVIRCLALNFPESLQGYTPLGLPSFGLPSLHLLF